MNVFKKFITLLSFAAVASAFSASTVNASLWSYKKGDVDDSGTVNIADLSTMQQVLHGVRYPSATAVERLDLNNDYVINAYDKSLISDILFGTSSTSTEFYEFTNALPSPESREYYVCSPLTGYPNYNYTYSLSTPSNLNDLPDLPRVIIGNDDRVKENGLDGVINVRYYGMNIGTAFVVDSHTLLTAAHVVYGKSNLQFKIFSNYNTVSNVQITPTAYHVPSLYVTGNNQEKYDYALVTVQEDLEDYTGYGYNHHSFINFDLGLMRNELPHTVDIYATGFGGNHNNINPELAYVKSTGSGYLLDTPISERDYSIRFSTDIVGGDSGGPVYVKNQDGSKTVIGISAYECPSGQYNSGTRITSDILRFVYDNQNLSNNYSF